MAVWRWLVSGLLVLLCLGTCTAVPDPTPTPVQNVAEVATLVVERPSATHLPTLTPTPQATATPEPVVTDEMPRVTAVPTFTPIPSPTPDPHLSQVATSNGRISHVTVSSLGQLAFIEGSVLWVETAAGEFAEIGSYAQTAVWSPDGSQLLYSLTNTFDIFNDPNASFEQRLWSAADGSDISLSELITNYPSPPYNVFDVFWSPDGTKILMKATLDKRYDAAVVDISSHILVTVDLNQSILTGDNFIPSNQRPVWLTDEFYVLWYHCGSPCASISVYDYLGNLIWAPEQATNGLIAFAPVDNFMINMGYVPNGPADDISTAAVEEISLATGEAEVLWEKPRTDGYFTAFFMPYISPDENFISLNYGAGRTIPNTLYIIDRNGKEIVEYPNSFVLGWRPNGDLAIGEMLESREDRLVYLTLAGDSKVIFTTEPGIKITGAGSASDGGLWSPDGCFFIFTTESYEKDLSQFYLWSPENEELRLILTEGWGHQSFTWLPDSSAFYFTTRNGIWRYKVETAD